MELTDGQARQRRIRYLKALDLSFSVGRVLQADDCARSIELRFRKGSRLAVFECLALWKAEGLPFQTLPGWAIEELGKIGSVYYEACIASHLKNKKNLPRFEQFAGLGGTKGKPDEFRVADISEKAKSFKTIYDLICTAAANGEPEYQTWEDSAGKPVKVLDRRGRPTREFTVTIVRTFGVRGNSSDADYRTARRMLRSASLED